MDDIDVNKILASKKEPYGRNNSLIYFIGYNYVYGFQKRLVILMNLMKIRIQ